ncbi:MAG: UDP-N-acetylmuramate dehydrogenase [Deltaproteobacteria bacterium]|nr:UDP-N-acetylmuramate dehydrogenase [Deltaproteobacteria bacterium]
MSGRQLIDRESRSKLESLVSLPVREDVHLAQYTSFHIGGPAALFIEANNRQTLVKTLASAKDLGLETLILGGGTNLLVSDDGFDGLALRLDIGGIDIDKERRTVRVGASIQTCALVEQLVDEGFAGLEFATGLPGTVGGAIAGNAGCFGHCLSDFLICAEVVSPEGDLRRITDKSWFDFSYRRSGLARYEAVLTEMTFQIEPGDKSVLRQKTDEYLSVRAEKHPKKGMHTAGSYFKNLPPPKPGQRRQAAGALLDQAGAHGLSVGDAAVFEKHANIIINRANATARDVLSLAAKMKKLVQDKFSVDLTEEVRFIGKKPEKLRG